MILNFSLDFEKTAFCSMQEAVLYDISIVS